MELKEDDGRGYREIIETGVYVPDESDGNDVVMDLVKMGLELSLPGSESAVKDAEYVCEGFLTDITDVCSGKGRERWLGDEFESHIGKTLQNGNVKMVNLKGSWTV